MISRFLGGPVGWLLLLVVCWAPALPAAPAQGDFELLVLLAEDGAPAAGAMLRYEPPGGKVLRGRTDASGRLRLVTPAEGAPLEVTFADRRSALVVPAGQNQPLVVRLTRPLSIEVLVRGPGGEPAAGVSVSLRGAGRRAAGAAGPKPLVFVLAQGATDAEGRGRIEDMSGLFFEPRSLDIDWHVHLDLMALDAPRVPLPAGEVPAQPVELALPPLGEVVVELQGRGAPVEAGTSIALAVRSEEPLPEVVGAADGEGRVRFERVGFGLSLYLTTVDWSAPLPGPEFEGPTQERPRVTLAWQLPQRPPVLMAQLFDEIEGPLAEGLALDLRVTWPNGEYELRGWRVDGEGRMRAELPEELIAVEGVHAEFDVTPKAGPAAVSPRRYVRVPLSTLVSGPNRADPIHVPPAPLVAVGTVRARGGEPLPGAQLRLVASTEPHEGPEGPLAGLAGAGGSFELRAPTAAERVHVRVTAPGYRPLLVEVTRGERQLLLELEAEPVRR